MKVTKEKQLYEVIKEKLEEILKTKFNDFYLEITADTGFSNKLKSEIPRGREIIFNFLKKLVQISQALLKKIHLVTLLWWKLKIAQLNWMTSTKQKSMLNYLGLSMPCLSQPMRFQKK